MKQSCILMVVLMLSGMLRTEIAGQNQLEVVNYSTTDGGSIEAALFATSTEKVVIFAHGAVFNKESWYVLAKQFQSVGIASLSIDFRGYGNSIATNLNQRHLDIIGAINYLTNKGYSEICIVGGSMGAAAVLEALSDPQSIVTKVVLLAPAGGPPLLSRSINKLVVVAKDEAYYNRVKAIFDKSSNPKILKEYDGSAHAQHMFKEDYAEELAELIINFVKG